MNVFTLPSLCASSLAHADIECCHAHADGSDLITNIQGDPKYNLYRHVYDPLVVLWFEELVSGGNLEVQGLSLETTLREIIQVFDATADRVVDRLCEFDVAIHKLLEHHRYADWAGELVPPGNPSFEDIRASLRHKLKRNIGQAVLEGVLILESARLFLLELHGIEGSEARNLLDASASLVGSLGVLHDDRQKALIQIMVGRPGFSYPSVMPWDNALVNRTIGHNWFRLTTVEGVRRVRLVSIPPLQLDLSSPTMMCPAHRIRDSHGQRWNDTLWHLLVKVFAYAGVLAEK